MKVVEDLANETPDQTVGAGHSEQPNKPAPTRIARIEHDNLLEKLSREGYEKVLQKVFKQHTKNRERYPAGRSRSG
ncbi:hypothetical protein [Burkholderia cenocepacia]|uniref:hypothetical protein n=1 Tax=Burkholderia cenocepacia TaxID=95486 RepID=UPI0012B1B2A2|nr:hypothetical protein [Burkholderia cenocepacia]